MSISISTNSLPVFSSTSSTIGATSSGLFHNGQYLIVASNTTTYNVLGENITLDGYKDFNTANIIAIINVLGKPYYDELRKQGISLPDKIDSFLEEKFRILERDRKINSVIDK